MLIAPVRRVIGMVRVPVKIAETRVPNTIVFGRLAIGVTAVFSRHPRSAGAAYNLYKRTATTTTARDPILGSAASFPANDGPEKHPRPYRIYKA